MLLFFTLIIKKNKTLNRKFTSPIEINELSNKQMVVRNSTEAIWKLFNRTSAFFTDKFEENLKYQQFSGTEKYFYLTNFFFVFIIVQLQLGILQTFLFIRIKLFT